ncbi:MAG TPA: hypothetical protein VFE05_10085 [Longimicrobiaceae bacterium]|jgi:hypothetical protein|nr:hypothetical protein [Longimicrobiaceae bacterium]
MKKLESLDSDLFRPLAAAETLEVVGARGTSAVFTGPSRRDDGDGWDGVPPPV